MKVAFDHQERGIAWWREDGKYGFFPCEFIKKNQKQPANLAQSLGATSVLLTTFAFPKIVVTHLSKIVPVRYCTYYVLMEAMLFDDVEEMSRVIDLWVTNLDPTYHRVFSLINWTERCTFADGNKKGESVLRFFPKILVSKKQRRVNTPLKYKGAKHAHDQKGS